MIQDGGDRQVPVAPADPARRRGRRGWRPAVRRAAPCPLPARTTRARRRSTAADRAARAAARPARPPGRPGHRVVGHREARGRSRRVGHPVVLQQPRHLALGAAGDRTRRSRRVPPATRPTPAEPFRRGPRTRRTPVRSRTCRAVRRPPGSDFSTVTSGPSDRGSSRGAGRGSAGSRPRRGPPGPLGVERLDVDQARRPAVGLETTGPSRLGLLGVDRGEHVRPAAGVHHVIRRAAPGEPTRPVDDLERQRGVDRQRGVPGRPGIPRLVANPGDEAARRWSSVPAAPASRCRSAAGGRGRTRRP